MSRIGIISDWGLRKQQGWNQKGQVTKLGFRDIQTLKIFLTLLDLKHSEIKRKWELYFSLAVKTKLSKINLISIYKLKLTDTNKLKEKLGFY